MRACDFDQIAEHLTDNVDDGVVSKEMLTERPSEANGFVP